MMRAFALAIILAFASLCAGCLSNLPFATVSGDGKNPLPLGSFAVTSERVGRQTIAPTTCASGDRQSFLGGDFADPDSGMVVRLVVDPLEGPAVRIFAGAAEFDKSIVFRRPECSTFHFSLDSTGWTINDNADYRISLQLDCSNGNGDAIKGDASTTHCH